MSQDAKSKLTQLVQKIKKDNVTAGDIEYTSQKFDAEVPPQYQATVTLHVFGGEQYAGDVNVNDKLAQQSAADYALQDVTENAESLSAQFCKPSQANKAGDKSKLVASANRRAEALPPPAKKAKLASTAGANAALTKKVELNTLLMKLLRRPLAKGEASYQSEQTEGGFQGTVTLNCPGLPNGWEGMTWSADEISSTKPLAEQEAAAAAFDALSGDPELAAQAGYKSAGSPAFAAAVAAQAAEKQTRLAAQVNALSGTVEDLPEEPEKPQMHPANSVNACLTSKLILNSHLMKLLRRPLTKGEASYQSQKLEDGFQATVTLNCPDLPEQWQGQAWAGDISASKQEAEQQAAGRALEHLENDPELAALAGRPKNKTTKTNNAGNSSGKALGTKGGFKDKGCKGKGKSKW